MQFGIYPGGVAYDLTAQTIEARMRAHGDTLAALRTLQGQAGRFYVRGYRPFHGPRYGGQARVTPPELEPYLGEGREADLVLQYQSEEGDVEGFVRFVREAVRGMRSGKVQVTEEANVPYPLDGGYPGVYDALVAGVLAAKQEAPELMVGFNAAVPGPEFWAAIAERATPAFLAAVDFVGLDCFPDVFRPLPFERMGDAVGWLLGSFRAGMTGLGLGAGVPIHVSEHGWPTGPEHAEERQAEVLEQVVRAVCAHPGVTAYEFFCLLDGDSASANRHDRYGLLRDDGTAKPAFETYRRLIAELS